MSKGEDDDWRGWIEGKYDNRYEGVRKHPGSRDEPYRRASIWPDSNKWRNYKRRRRRNVIIAGSLVSALVILSFMINWSDIFQQVAKQIEQRQPLDTAKKNIDEIVKILQPLISEPYVAPTPAENTAERPNSTSTPVLEPSKPLINVTELEQEVHDLINYYRKQNGLKQLKFNLQLTDIARKHSQDMANKNYFSHINLQGEDPTDRAESQKFYCRIDLPNGYYVAGIAENIWQGWTYSYTVNGIPAGHYTQSQLAKQIVDSWMSSQGHRQNILTDYTQSEGIGIAITKEGKVYVTQNFC